MSQVEQTAEEVMESLTGHDEMAIAEHFGQTVMTIAEKDPSMLGRALVFVTRRRIEGLNDDDARNFALDLPLKSVNDYFTDPAEESEEAGKGEPEPQEPPVTSLTSVS